jgi:hypothetical protein
MGSRWPHSARLTHRFPQEIPGVAAKIPYSRPPAAHNGCLKFNRAFEKFRPPENEVMRYIVVRRFLSKLIQDILPGALASLIGGFLLTHYGFYGLGRPPEPAAVQSALASVVMMDVLRDEHTLVANFVKAKTASEKKQAQAMPAEADAAEPNGAPADPVTIAAARPQPVAITAVKGTAAHGKALVVDASLPLVIAQTQPSEGAQPAAPRDHVFFTAVIKDHVVAATQRAVAVIGGIPSWFGAIGDRIGGQSNAPRPPVDLVSAS